MRNAVSKRAAIAMMHKIANEYASSPLPEWDTFERNVRLYNFGKGAIVDLPSYEIMIVLNGGMKLNYDDEPLKGQIAQFFFTGSVASNSPEPLWRSNKPGPFSITRYIGNRRNWPKMTMRTIEMTTIACFDYRLVTHLASKYPQWGEVHAAFLWTYIEAMFDKINALQTKDVSERYLALMQRRDARAKLTQRDIAAYLGIDERSLWRLKKRLNGQDMPELDDFTPSPLI